jgi:hypothetical protein
VGRRGRRRCGLGPQGQGALPRAGTRSPEDTHLHTALRHLRRLCSDCKDSTHQDDTGKHGVFIAISSLQYCCKMCVTFTVLAILECMIQHIEYSRTIVQPSLLSCSRALSLPQKGNTAPMKQRLPIPLSSQPLETTILPSVCMDLAIPDTSYTRNPKICETSTLAEHYIFKIHPCDRTHPYCVPCYGQIVFRYVDRPHFVYPCINWWTFGLFPPFGYCE